MATKKAKKTTAKTKAKVKATQLSEMPKKQLLPPSRRALDFGDFVEEVPGVGQGTQLAWWSDGDSGATIGQTSLSDAVKLLDRATGRITTRAGLGLKPSRNRREDYEYAYMAVAGARAKKKLDQDPASAMKATRWPTPVSARRWLRDSLHELWKDPVYLMALGLRKPESVLAVQPTAVPQTAAAVAAPSQAPPAFVHLARVLSAADSVTALTKAVASAEAATDAAINALSLAVALSACAREAGGEKRTRLDVANVARDVSNRLSTAKSYLNVVSQVLSGRAP